MYGLELLRNVCMKRVELMEKRDASKSHLQESARVFLGSDIDLPSGVPYRSFIGELYLSTCHL
jgi:hypothetical protein